jgi:hypothetical protein
MCPSMEKWINKVWYRKTTGESFSHKEEKKSCH